MKVGFRLFNFWFVREMKAYFDLVLDLLEIDEKEPLSALAEELALAHQQGKRIKIAHRHQVLLEGRLLLVAGKLSPEEFVQIGDVESALPLWKEEGSRELLQQLQSWMLPEEELIIIDERAWKLFLSPDQQQQLLHLLEKENKAVIVK